MRFAAAVIVPWLIWGALDAGIYTLLAGASPETFPADSLTGAGAATLLLVLRGGYDFIAGWTAGKIADGRDKAVYAAAGLLLATGIAVQIRAWSLYPLWYQLIFLGSIVPLALWGAKVARTAE